MTWFAIVEDKIDADTANIQTWSPNGINHDQRCTSTRFQGGRSPVLPHDEIPNLDSVPRVIQTRHEVLHRIYLQPALVVLLEGFRVSHAPYKLPYVANHTSTFSTSLA